MSARLAIYLSCLFSLLLSPITNAAELPPVAGALPDTFKAAIIVPNMGEMSDGIAAFETAAELGIGELQDTLGMFQRELGMISGLKRDGSMMVIVTGGTAEGDAAGVMIVPVADYAALANSLGGDATQPTTAVTLPGGASGFCRSLDGYAVLSGDEAAVNAIALADGADMLSQLLGENGITAVGESQLSVVVNTSATEPEALAQYIASISAQVMRQLDEVFAVDLSPEPWMPMLRAASKTAGNGTSAMVFGFSFSKDGLRYTEAAMLKDDTDLAAAFKSAKQADTSAALASLPQDTFLFAAAGDPQAVSLAFLLDQLGGVLGLAPENALGQIKPLVDDLLVPATAQATAVYAVPASDPTGRWLNSATVLRTSDPQAQRAAVEKFIIALNGAELPTDSGDAIKLIAMYRKEAKEIEGIQVDTFTIRAQIPESAKTTPLIGVIALLAGGGITGQVASTDDAVVLITVDDDAFLTRVIAQSQAGGGVASTGPVADLRANHLPTDLTVQAYLDFNGIADSLNPLLQLMGNVRALQVPENLPPVAVGISSDATSIRAVTFIPAPTARLLVNESFELTAPAVDAQ